MRITTEVPSLFSAHTLIAPYNVGFICNKTIIIKNHSHYKNTNYTSITSTFNPESSYSGNNGNECVINISIIFNY